MALSAFDLFKIGIGPSSSHTMGPMLAAWHFANGLLDSPLSARVARIQVDLHGSLGTTGRGHATDRAVILGLSGELPECITQERIHQLEQQILQEQRLPLGGVLSLSFQSDLDIRFHQENLPAHPNGMCLTALDAAGAILRASSYYSVGGGFVQDEQGRAIRSPNAMQPKDIVLPHPFVSGDDLLGACERSGLSIAQLMWDNELQWRSGDEIRSGLLNIWHTMREAIERGCQQHGTLPGSRVARRAADLHAKLTNKPAGDGLDALDWVNLYAMAVNEENACGGRVVTAPTNGAAGVVPAVLQHHLRRSGATDSEQSVIDFLLTAAAIGIVYKQTGSLSGAEVGCQGEVGVASSMAAAGLAAVMGGSPRQIENAAEIGMEHFLGMTCDPVGGLVQIPCIERNAMGAIKAINAARIALRGDGQHCVSLDQVIRVMMQTGADMKSVYKETSLGGLAINVVVC